jgi:hypothetical protein
VEWFFGCALADALHEPRCIRTSRIVLAGTLAALLSTLGAPSHADPKRPVPDYDGRGNPDADADSWVLWIPRVVLSPLYLTNEYVLRRPLGALVRKAERDRWADSFVQLFTFGEGGKNLIVPTALFDFGLLPSVGFYYSGDDFLAHGNVLRLHGATWGKRWINATLADRYALGDAQSVQARFEFKRSEDNLFVGIGPDAVSGTQSRFGLERVDGTVRYRRTLARQSRLDVAAGIQHLAFLDGDCCNDPSIDTRIASGDLMTPPGYRDPYTTVHARVDLSLDTRRPRPEPGSGYYLQLEAQPSVDVQGSRSWIEYGGVAGGALDLTGRRRTLRLQLALDFVDRMTGDSIPFTEYASFDRELLPGFLPGWLIGRSTAAAQLGYTWPVWLGLDAQARFTVGNAFGARLDGFAADKLRMSGDVGFTTSTARDQGFELLFGLGTETFEQGAGITSVRVTLGSRRGF